MVGRRPSLRLAGPTLQLSCLVNHTPRPARSVANKLSPSASTCRWPATPFACGSMPRIARRIVPGQFVMLRLAGTTIRCLDGRWHCMIRLSGPQGAPEGLDIVYQVMGRMTGSSLGFQPGQEWKFGDHWGMGFRRRT